MFIDHVGFVIIRVNHPSNNKVEKHVEFVMEYFASFGTAMVPTMGLHKSVLHVLAKRYAIYPKARQNNDTLANFVSVSFLVKSYIELVHYRITFGLQNKSRSNQFKTVLDTFIYCTNMDPRKNTGKHKDVLRGVPPALRI